MHFKCYIDSLRRLNHNKPMICGAQLAALLYYPVNPMWNSLSNHVVSADTVNTYKDRLDV